MILIPRIAFTSVTSFYRNEKEMKAGRGYDTRVRDKTSLEPEAGKSETARGPPARGQEPSPEGEPFGPASPLQEFVL
jgi:hypothetical protein